VLAFFCLFGTTITASIEDSKAFLTSEEALLVSFSLYLLWLLLESRYLLILSLKLLWSHKVAICTKTQQYQGRKPFSQKNKITSE
jgi:hypothetical protein